MTDDAELERIRKGIAARVLNLSEAECETAIKAVSQKMKTEKNKRPGCTLPAGAAFSGRQLSIVGSLLASLH